MRIVYIFLVGLMVVLTAPATRGDQSAPSPPPRLELTLAESVALALQNNRTLAHARLDRVVQKFDLSVAEDEFRPDIDIGSGLDYRIAWEADRRRLEYDEGVSLFPVLSVRLPTGGAFAVGLNNAFQDFGTQDAYTASPSLHFVQPLLKGGGTEVATANLRNARRQEEIHVLSFQSAVIGVVNAVVSAYRNVIQAQRQVEISARSLQRAREQLDVNRFLVQTGRMAENDVVQTEANIATRELHLTESQNRLDSARLSLIHVLDIDSRTQIEPTEPLTIAPVSPDLSHSLDTAFARRPDYLRALLSLENIRTNVVVAENNRLWDLSFGASVSASGSRKSFRRTLGSALGDIVNRGVYGVGLGLSIPLYGDVTRQQQYVRAHTALRQAEQRLTELRQHIDIEVRNAVRDVEVRLRQVELAQRARELAEEKIAIEREKLTLGLSTNFQLVVFEDDLVTAQNNEVSAIIAYLHALTAFDRTLGTTLETWKIDITRLED